jgi:bifunctional DNA-binding transcriptional regulator/antitoxin component of YhaV-PrlF toxin-antitoxin module
MEAKMATTIKENAIPLSEEILAAAGIKEGDSVYVDVDAEGVIHVERTQIYESGEEFLASIRARIDE